MTYAPQNFYPKNTKDKNKILDYSSNFLKKRIEILDQYNRSNQDTSLIHKPAVNSGDWVQSGDLLADSSASMNGELAIGKNIIVAYMPWEGYNYEDAILINERLVYDDVYTSIHIERYEIETKEGQLGSDKITREIPDIAPEAISHLDANGIAKVGSWIEEGDILVGKVTPINKKSQTPYQKLLFKLLDKSLNSIRDSSLRAPKGIKANVINVHILEGVKELTSAPRGAKKLSKKNKAKNLGLKKVNASRSERKNLMSSKTSRVKLPLPSGGLKTNSTNDANTESNLALQNQSKNLVLPPNLTGLKKWMVFNGVKSQSNTSRNSATNFINAQSDPQNNLLSLRGNKDLFNGTTTAQFDGSVPLQIKGGYYIKAEAQIETQNLTKNQTSFNLIKSSSPFLSNSNKTVGGFKTNPSLSLRSDSWQSKNQMFSKASLKNKTKVEAFNPGVKSQDIFVNKVTNTVQQKPQLIPNSYINTAYTGLKRKTFTSKQKSFPRSGLKLTTNGFGNALTHQQELTSNLVTKTKKSSLNYNNLQKYNSAFPQGRQQSFKLTPTLVHIYLAEKRKIQVGDKMAGRHGNKGIISNILPREDMPFLPDGTPIDIVLNPLGVPSRMNVGQIYECLLGLAGKYLGEHYKIFPFDEIYGAEASRSFVFAKLFEARKKTGIEWLFDPNSPGKMRIFDGRTSEGFDQPVTIGIAYMLKLVHMVDDKIHARSTGPYSLVTQQPLRGRAKQGGQRLGEMEVWAIEGYGAAFVLLEMLTLKSDDMTGRLTLWSNIILNKDITIGTPESFKVLVCELQALCLDIGLFRVSNINLDSTSNSQVINNASNLEFSAQQSTVQPELLEQNKTSTALTKVKSKKKSVLLQEISNLMLLP